MKYCNTNWLQRLTIYIENKGNEVHHYKLSLIKTKAELKTSTMHTWRSEYTEQKVINWLLPNKTTVHKCCSGKSLHSWGGQHLNFYHSLHGILAQYHQVVWTVLHCSIPPLLDLQIFAPTICTYWCSNCNMALSPKYFCLKSNIHKTEITQLPTLFLHVKKLPVISTALCWGKFLAFYPWMQIFFWNSSKTLPLFIERTTEHKIETKRIKWKF